MINSFNKALKKTLSFEGGYSNHNNDKGGETVFGIARKFHENLPLWNEIDNYKKLDKEDFERIISDFRNNIIMSSVKDFYLHNYYYKYKCNLVFSESARVSEYLFDCVVNHGSSGVKILQNALNSFGGGIQFKPLVIDGAIGPKTLDVLALIVEFGNSAELMDRFKEQRVKFYVSICKRDESQLVFINGWINRTFGVLREVV
jgi:lysozyme family protein